MPPFIRDERPGDFNTIATLTDAAFAGHPHSRQTEARIIDVLRRAGALTVSLVAEDDGAVVGHIAFSPVIIDSGATGWYGLGPVAVAPDWQARGIGSALVNQGLERLHGLGAGGCVLVGEPGFYDRFGFFADPQLRLADVPPKYFLCLPLAMPAPSGAVHFHPAFAITA